MWMFQKPQKPCMCLASGWGWRGGRSTGFSNALVCLFIFITGKSGVQPAFVLQASSNPPYSASQVAGSPDVHSCPVYLLFCFVIVIIVFTILCIIKDPISCGSWWDWCLLDISCCVWFQKFPTKVKTVEKSVWCNHCLIRGFLRSPRPISPSVVVEDHSFCQYPQALTLRSVSSLTNLTCGDWQWSVRWPSPLTSP